MKSKSPFNMLWKHSHLDILSTKPSSSSSSYNYIKKICATSLAERMDDITKPLSKVAEIGSSSGEFANALIEQGKFMSGEEDDSSLSSSSIEHFEQIVWRKSQLAALPDTYKGLKSYRKSAFEEWTSPSFSLAGKNKADDEGSFDLIASNLSLHWVNDIGDIIKKIKTLLKPDGVFLGTMFGGDTLHELRASLAIAEQEREGGISPHISPMFPIADACSLLSNGGLKLVTVDTAQIQIEYDNAFALMRHLWWMGESNASTNRRLVISRETMLAAAAIYEHLYGIKEGNKTVIPATFNIIFMIGWAPHESQAVPLEPGQAQVSLTKLGKGYSG
jgi:NADH dehydrogenase [ubiquinone] 1 alpha subcomplex assembly factor 5